MFTMTGLRLKRLLARRRSQTTPTAPDAPSPPPSPQILRWGGNSAMPSCWQKSTSPKPSVKPLPSVPAAVPCITFIVCNQHPVPPIVLSPLLKPTPPISNAAHPLSNAQFIDFLQRCSALSANDGSAVSANKRIRNRFLAYRAIKNFLALSFGFLGRIHRHGFTRGVVGAVSAGIKGRRKDWIASCTSSRCPVKK